MLLRNVTVKAPGSDLLLVEDLTLSVGRLEEDDASDAREGWSEEIYWLIEDQWFCHQSCDSQESALILNDNNMKQYE